jgi:hypothetical protein
MAAALMTTTALSIAGQLAAIYLGYAAQTEHDILGHATFGFFVTVITLLAHSMTIFYLIGMIRTIKDAAAQHQRPGTFASDIAAIRRRVFSRATMAMALTMAAAILGGGVDTKVLPAAVHGGLGFVAIAANVWAFRSEIGAFGASARMVGTISRWPAAP